jgi:mannosyl-oligosaccharide alpha-1,2-mannosidase
MDLPDIVDKILDHIAQIDYSKTDISVSLFETTIRYLGGMLAGYDLLKGPLSGLEKNVRAILLRLTLS